MKMKEVITFDIGDFCADGHGKHDTILIQVTSSKDAIESLQEAEEKIKTDLGIDLSKWFEEFEDRVIPSEDVEKLKKHGIAIKEDDLKDKGLVIYCVGDYFDIWKQLVMKVNSDIKIEEYAVRSFYGKCTGYGLHEL